MNVFVSYSHLDIEFTRRLVDALRSWGHTPWLDSENIPKGTNWSEEIDRGIRCSRCCDRCSFREQHGFQHGQRGVGLCTG